MDKQAMMNALHQRYRQIVTFSGGYAYLGRGDGTTTVIANSTTRRVYCYSTQGFFTAVLDASIDMPSLMEAVGYRVRLGYPPYDPDNLYVLGFDTGEGLQALGGVTPGEQWNAASKYPDIGRLMNLRIAPQDTPDKTVAVNGGAYITPGGQWAFFLQDSIDLTSQIAALSASTHTLALICLNTTTGALAAVTATAETGGSANKSEFGVGTIELLIIPSGYAPLGAVHLYNGQTTITEGDLYREAEPRWPAIPLRKDNLSASTAPTVNDDSGDGYAIGSRWLDTFNDREYVCLDATLTAAVWVNTTGVSSAPINAKYIVQTADPNLTNEQALSLLESGHLRVTTGTGVVSSLKDNLNAGADPTVGDDVLDGYSIGSLWINTASDKVFMAVDVTAGAAVWKDLSTTGGGGGGSATWTEVEIDFGTTPIQYKEFTITDAGVSPTSNVAVLPSGRTATDRVGNDYALDYIYFSSVPGSGQFTLYAAVINGMVVGKRKIIYQIG